MASVESDIPGRFWAGWVMLAVEFIILVIVGSFPTLAWWIAKRRERLRVVEPAGIQAIWDVVTYRSTSNLPKLRLRGDKNLPSVDVFIIASGQPDQIVRSFPPHLLHLPFADAARQPDIRLRDRGRVDGLRRAPVPGDGD